MYFRALVFLRLFMKKIVLYFGFFVSLFLLSNKVDATHIMGGEVTWVCDAQGQYVFTFKTYRDCSGAAPGGPNTSWRIQNYPNVGQTLTLTENVSQRVDSEIGPNCRIGSPGFQNYSCVAGDPEVVFEYVRVMNPVRLNGIPPPAGWIVTYTQAARNANNNLLGATTPNAHNITLRAKIFPHSGSVANQCIDNSPQFREKATSLICRGSAFTYNHNATDDELDSLVYEWTSPLDGFTGTYNEGVNPAFIAFEPGFSFNNPFPGPETLNSATGEISVNSPTAGKYVSAVKVSAYKCGEKVSEIVRELQSVITGNCAVTQTKPTIDPPFSNGMGGFRYNDTVRAGDLVTFSLAARDIASLNLTTIPPYLGDTVFLTATGQQFGTNFTSTTGCLNPPCATLGTTLPAKGLLGVNTTFSWQTDCNHVSFTDRCISGQNTYTFVITATDDECPIPSLNISTISITVVGDTVIESPDVNCVNVLANGDVTLDWDLTPNINNSFTAWMIYSATDVNGPFVLLDSVKTYSTNTYTHVGANANNQQMHYVVRSRSGCKGIVQNIPKDTVSTIFVSATTNPTDVSVNWNAISNPNPVGSAAQYRVFREYPLGTGFNLYQSTASTSLTETFTPCADDVNYRVELVNASKGCTSSSNILNYTFKFPDPQTNFSFPNNQCPGTPITFTNLTTIVGGTVTYSWDFGDGSTVSTQTNPTHTYSAPGTFNVVLTATSGQGCDSILSQPITITFPNADAGTDQSICPGGSAPIGGAPTTALGNSISWSPAAGLSSTTSQNPIASPANTTTYTVTVTDGNGCTNTDQVDVVVIPFPNANAGGPKSVCIGSSVQIGGVPTGPIGATYAWSSNPAGFTSNLANPTVSPTVNTIYTVTVTIGTSTTCSDTDNALVIVNAIPTANAGPDQNICPGGSVQIGVAPSAGFTYSWTPTTGLSNVNIANPIATPTSPTTYTVVITETATSCIDSDAMDVLFNSVPTPSFTFTKTCINQIAEFTDASTIASGTITNWAWDFDDLAATSTAQNPTHQFSSAGTYQVKLVVTSNLGCKDSITVPVTIDPKPTVDFTFANLCLTNSTQFTDGSTIGSGTVNTWRWDFDGLGSSAAQNPSFTFPAAGTYDVKLVSGSGAGCLDSITKQVVIVANPTADAGPDQNICPGGSVQIGVAPSAGFTFSWTPTTGLSNVNIANPIATPISPTTYTVVITETATGCIDSDAMDVLFNSVPTPSFTFTKTCINQIAEFTDASTIASGTITNWAWDFDDLAATSTAQNPTHQFSSAGTYQVKLVVTSNLGCKDSITVPVTIDPKPTVDFTFANLCLTNSTQFTDGSTIGSGSVNTWRWDFDGLGSSAAQNPSFIFPAAGTYDVKLVSGSGAGCLDSITKQVIINPLPTADAGIDQDICNTFSVLIGGTPTSSTPNVSYNWDNSASLTSNTIANPTANPTITTRYSLTVTENTTGCFDTSSVLITVNPIPVVNFNVADTCAGNTTIFTDLSSLTSGSITNWTWDFGDGIGTSTQQNPTYTYALAGIYNVKLVAETGSGCKDSLTRTITVVPLPNIDAGADLVICNRDTVTLGGAPTSSTAGVSYSWDNAASLSNATIANPLAFPSVTTRYGLTVTETTTGCSDTASVVIVVNPVPVAAFTTADVCENLITQFTEGSSILSGSIVSWAWDFGDLSGTSSQQNPAYQYAAPGSYQVKLVVESALGCKDSIINTVVISPKPSPSFTFANLCENDVTQFTDASTIATGIITSWSWDFGDGVGVSTKQSPIYTFSTPNTYNVKLVVTSDFGCTDSITIPVTIDPLPRADAGPDQVICNTGTVQIGGSPSSSTPNVSYLWDNSASLNDNTLSNPVASPSTTTRYTLTVTENSTGCSDTSSVVVSVNPIPVVDFSVADTCIGNITLFTDVSTIAVGGINSWVWDFGDAVGTSTLQNPSYTYGSTGTYDVKLITVSTAGCTDSITKTITIVSLPGIDAGADQAICLNDSVTIGGTPTSVGTNVSYTWDNAGTLDDNTAANPIAKPIASTRYRLTVTDLSTGCFDTSSVVVLVNPLPNADFRASKVCSGNTTQFTDLSNISTPALIQNWTWDFGDNNGTSILQNPTYEYQSPGTYTVKLIVSTNSGCLDSIVRNVIVDTLPLADAGADRSICELDTTVLGKPNVTGETYSWNNSSTLTDATAAQPGAFPTVDTRYIVTVTNSNGCVSIDSVDITVTLAPNVDAGIDLTICNRDTITIGGAPTSTDPLATYLWNNAASLDDPTLANPRAFPNDTTAYVVTVTDALGCSATDTMIVNVNPLANVDFRVDADCEGDFAAFTDISTLSTGSIASWSWNFGDGVGTSTLQNPGYQYASPGSYSVLLEVQTALGCIDSIRKDVTIFPLPIADAGSDISICFGDTVSLGGNPTGPIGASYSWSPAFELSSVTDPNPRAYPTSSTIYYLTVTSGKWLFWL